MLPFVYLLIILFSLQFLAHEISKITFNVKTFFLIFIP